MRGTLVVIPGRGEQPAHYERFGRRIAADGYRVHAVTDPTADADLAAAQITGLLAGPGTPAPRVLAGSDTGALFAAGLAASGEIPGLDALVLAGLPAAQAAAAGPAAGSWDEELETRTACPTHRARLSAPGLRRGALYEPVPDGWTQRADLGAVRVPVLGIHGSDDPVARSPRPARVRPRRRSRAGHHRQQPARRPQRPHPPHGGGHRRDLPRTAAAGTGPAPHRHHRDAAGGLGRGPSVKGWIQGGESRSSWPALTSRA